MGLKWFRARMKIQQKNSSVEIPGHYRQFSQFDREPARSEDKNTPSTSEPRALIQPKNIPVSPVIKNLSPPQNPLAKLSNSEDDNNGINSRENFVPKIEMNSSKITKNKMKKKKKERAPVPDASIGENKNRSFIVAQRNKEYKESETEI
ncbi:uncharacterized protein LOC123272098 [Cotesia glomerata]|uniref:uncharacterized protein LOC123272098 n=1 Tax=Cotesia glomerata TaxID=32391 RepID=UPI001D00746D|nr:uncharacterized protein LOC123272098 [Cotesia glomerata]